MSVVAKNAVVAPAFVKAPWMRALILNMALSQGFTFEQVSNSTDRFTKGTTVVEVSWSNVVTTAMVTKGGKLAKQLPSGAQGKLQAITTWLGHKSMTPAQKWGASDLIKMEGGVKVRATKDELEAQAKTTFKVMAKV